MSLVETLPETDSADELDRRALPLDPRDRDPVEARAALDSLASRMFGTRPQPVRVGRFVLLERVGKGAMGVVYAAYDPDLDRKVAIKLLSAPGEAMGDRRGSDDQLVQEARAAARLDHPNVVTIHEVGTWDRGIYLAMEFVDGVTLRTWLTTARTRAEILDVFMQAGRGLAAAHSAAVIHRDFKPDNVLVGKDGVVRVVDFGLARAPKLETTARQFDSHGDVPVANETTQTRTGAVAGTPAYMAPEQHRGEAVTAAADQFAFCVALWEAWCGRRPFAGDNLASLSLAVTEGRLAPPPDGAMAARYRRLLERGLATDPQARHASMDTLLAALANDPIRRIRTAALGTAAAAVLVGAGLVAGRAASDAPDPCGGGAPRLAKVWGEGRRDEIAASFTATGLSYAETTAAQIAQRLELQADAWVTAHYDACAATRVRGEQSDELLDLRMACLDRRLAELDSLASLFASADAQTVTHAVRTADGLVPIDSCADTAALRASTPLPDDPAARDAIVDIADEIVRGSQLRDLGRFVEAVAIAEDALARATPTGHKPTIADAQVLLGSSQARAGDLQAAAKTLEEATWSAIAGRNGRAHATGAIALVTLVGHSKEDVEAGARWGEHARAVLEAQDNPPVSLAGLEGNLGNLAMTRGDRTAAIAHFRESLRLYESALGPEHFHVGRMLTNVAVALRQEGELDEAEVTYARALSVLERALGEGHPDLGPVLSNSGGLSFARGALDVARARFEQALAIGEGALPANHPQLGHAHNNLGETMLALGDHRGAQDHLRRAIAIWEASLGERHSLLASPYALLGRSLLATGARADAIVALEHALGLPRTVAVTDQLAAAETALAQARGHAGGAAHVR